MWPTVQRNRSLPHWSLHFAVINAGATVGNGRVHGRNDRSHGRNGRCHGEMTIFGGPDQALSIPNIVISPVRNLSPTGAQ